MLLQQRRKQEPGKIIQDLGYPAGHDLQPDVEKSDANKQLGAKRVYAKAH